MASSASLDTSFVNRIRARAFALGAASFYALAFRWCYVAFLHRQFGYVGYDLYERETSFTILSVGLAIAPVVCYRGIRTISSVIAMLVYVALYVPIVLTFGLGSSRPADEIIGIQLCFLVGMCLIFLADVAVIKNPLRLTARGDLMPLILAMTAATTAYLLFVYRSNLSFSSFGEDLYVQRAANQDLGSSFVARYLSSWLTTVLSPLCVAYGLVTRRYRYFWTGAAASLVLYMGAANKISILLPVASIAFFCVMGLRANLVFPTVVVAIATIVGGLTALSPAPGTLFYLATGIFLNRTIGNGGLLTMTYYDYFLAHPRTDFSHVHGLNLITTPYPYGNLTIGQVIGDFYWSPFMNANANFWATDGIAGIGRSGIVVISICSVVVLGVLNSITRDFDLRFVAICFLPFTTILLNQSLFSATWSGGALLLLVFFLFARAEGGVRNAGQRDWDAAVGRGDAYA